MTSKKWLKADGSGGATKCIANMLDRKKNKLLTNCIKKLLLNGLHHFLNSLRVQVCTPNSVFFETRSHNESLCICKLAHVVWSDSWTYQNWQIAAWNGLQNILRICLGSCATSSYNEAIRQKKRGCWGCFADANVRCDTVCTMLFLSRKKKRFLENTISGVYLAKLFDLFDLFQTVFWRFSDGFLTVFYRFSTVFWRFFWPLAGFL